MSRRPQGKARPETPNFTIPPEVMELMQEDLSKLAPQLKRDQQGLLTPQAILAFRQQAVRFGYLIFKPRREEILSARLEAYKAKNQQEYVKQHRQLVAESGRVTSFIQAKMCQLLQVPGEVFQNSMKRFQQAGDKSKAAWQAAENNGKAQARKTRMSSDDHIEKLMAAMMKKYELEYNARVKIEELKDKLSSQQQQEASQIEMAKVSDALKIEYGVDSETLMDLSKTLDLQKMPLVVQAQKEIQQKAQAEKHAKMFKEHAPEQAILDQVVEEAKAVGEPTISADGVVDFDWFLKAITVVQKHTNAIMKEKMSAKIAERRIALKLKNPKVYQQYMSDVKNFKANTKTHMMIAVFSTVKCPKSVLDKSMQQFNANPEQRAAYEANKKANESKRIPKELSKDETLAAVKAYQKNRSEMTRMGVDALLQGANPQRIYGMLKMSNIKCADQLYNDTGVDFKDMQFNVQRLNLKKEQVYMEIKTATKAQISTALSKLPAQQKATMERLVRRVQKRQGAKNWEGAGDASNDVHADQPADDQAVDVGESTALPNAEAPDENDSDGD